MNATDDRTAQVAPQKIDPFGAEYGKARKSYGLASALLLAWALIGIEIREDVLSSYKIHIKSPQAAPAVLFAAVLYFGFRFTIEWNQSDQARRQALSSRIDYFVAHGLGAIAILVAGIQEVLGVQIANSSKGIWSAALVAVAWLSFGVGGMVHLLPKLKRQRSQWTLYFYGLVATLIWWATSRYGVTHQLSLTVSLVVPWLVASAFFGLGILLGPPLLTTMRARMDELKKARAEYGAQPLIDNSRMRDVAEELPGDS